MLWRLVVFLTLIQVSTSTSTSDTPEHLTDIDGYTLIKAKTMEKLKYSRIVLLCRIGMVYTVEWDRMDSSISSIWIKVGTKGNNSLRIGGIYREHFLIRQPTPNNFREQLEQEKRWKKVVSQWKSACNSGPCLVIGDINLDILKWGQPEQILENMVELVKTDISTLNNHQVIQGPTRFWERVQPSLIDHCWVNQL